MLPDVVTKKRKRRFRGPVRERKIRRIRIIQVLTILLMISSIDIVLSILRGEDNRVMLAFAVIYFLLVMVFQIITLFSTRNLIAKSGETEVTKGKNGEGQFEPYRSPELTPGSPDYAHSSVVEGTTELIEPSQSKRGPTTDPLTLSFDA